VYVHQGSATLSGGQIISNTATSGGGVHIYKGSATLSGGQIISNTASYGGGVYLGYSTAAFTQTGTTSTIAGNAASLDGGGVHVYNGSATLSGGQILGNTASYGGGVYLGHPAATFTQIGTTSTIADNAASLDGGGVHVFDGSATLSGGQIVSNTATSGGGVYVDWGSATLSGGQIISNTADHGGGAYNSDNGTLTIINSTLSGNQASTGSGGGLYSSGTSLITYTTIASNTAATGGSGIHRADGTVALQNSIVAYNGTTNCNNVMTSNDHNLEDTDTCGLTASGDLTDTNPLLGPLTYESGTWVHPLPPSSPAIDAATCITGITTDQRGMARPQGDGCDIGAYEYEIPVVYLPLVLRKSG